MVNATVRHVFLSAMLAAVALGCVGTGDNNGTALGVPQTAPPLASALGYGARPRTTGLAEPAAPQARLMLQYRTYF